MWSRMSCGRSDMSKVWTHIPIPDVSGGGPTAAEFWRQPFCGALQIRLWRLVAKRRSAASCGNRPTHPANSLTVLKSKR
jgi:hypothetical protein